MKGSNYLIAGIIGAQRNGHGVVGIAPGVTLVPIKVCDADGHCYASDVIEGITYAGDQALNVINMSFFTDDDEFQASTEFKCQSDSTQSARRARRSASSSSSRRRLDVQAWRLQVRSASYDSCLQR